MKKEREIYLKQLSHMIVGAGKSQAAGLAAGGRPREELTWQLESEGHLPAEPPLAPGTELFSLKARSDEAHLPDRGSFALFRVS